MTIFIAGLSSVIAQTLILREGLTIFSGYELSSGILLCFWLIWGGVGSIVFNWIKKHDPIRMASILLFVQCVSLIVSMVVLRCAHRIFSLPYGEVISLGNMLLVPCIALAPLCVVFGALFPTISRVLSPVNVYLIEGLGAFIGGIVITFILLQIVPPFGIALLVIVLLLVSAFLLLKKTLLAVLSCVMLLGFIGVQDIELFFRTMQMQHQDVIAVKESRYGLIVVTRSAEQINFYSGGVYDFSFPDPFSTEEAVHYPMLLHTDPQQVLLIGGGISGCIQQILKHPTVKKVTYIELDPLLFKMGMMYLDECFNYGEKVTIVYGDARHYIKNTNECFDVIIVNLPDPVNAQINRFYTEEFVQEAERRMNPEGLFCIRVSAPPNIVSPLYGALLRTVRNTIEHTFEQVLVLPASQVTYIAAHYGLNTRSVTAVLHDRFEERGMDLQYVNPYFFDFELSPEKLAYLDQRINDSEGTVNTDMKPVCYYYTMLLWGGVVSKTIQDIFVWLFHVSSWVFLIPLVLVVSFYRRRSIVYLSIASVGASEISAEVVLVILFQVLYGYLYGWIGAIIACYMLGLAIGTVFYLKTSLVKKNPVMVLSVVEFIMAVYFALMLIITFVSLPGIHIVIPALVSGGGIIGGLHFPLSIAILGEQKAGVVYGVDLIGSAIGALLTAIILIPILGIQFTMFLFIVLNILIGIGLRTISKQ